ncbi:glycerate kinase [Alkalihalobacterium chitinilyticum]|uniref:Glycerate kinase n=1 Tax=Alkalihalobacterium chitinilyticum TaxID=2980103 RepID=A0ABT5VIV6_9BACI|nr:glycerate kinase [Alkalihalobacterium chitinilyticum]MDE5415388.1 glycerate kinase [Alkalihalobacterium chitinilyticum]
MKIIIAPDSFKGSISAKELCSAIGAGIRPVFPKAELIELPMADGGEGTMENLVHATNGTIINVSVTDPLGRSIPSAYGVLGDEKTAVIEMAQASGLPLLREQERNPLRASSFGTGELILHALDQGYRKFIIGLGGSATNDGGMGMLQALGVKFFMKTGQLIKNDVSDLLQLDEIDLSTIDQRLTEAEFVIASDVTNPLCGPNGASHIFGPQKGATPEMVKILDESLDQYGKVINERLNINIHSVPGAGAAGGMGAGLIAFLGAKVMSGIDTVMEAVQFESQLDDACLVITGEGKLDEQTLSGKVISGVCKVANYHNIPVIAICGSNELSSGQLARLGVVAAFSIVSGPCSVETAMSQAESFVVQCIEQIMSVYRLSFGKQQG